MQEASSRKLGSTLCVFANYKPNFSLLNSSSAYYKSIGLVWFFFLENKEVKAEKRMRFSDIKINSHTHARQYRLIACLLVMCVPNMLSSYFRLIFSVSLVYIAHTTLTFPFSPSLFGIPCISSLIFSLCVYLYFLGCLEIKIVARWRDEDYEKGKKYKTSKYARLFFTSYLLYPYIVFSLVVFLSCLSSLSFVVSFIYQKDVSPREKRNKIHTSEHLYIQVTHIIQSELRAEFKMKNRA